ncbi:MAG TPA: PAS domain S-box protein [Candidatus Binatia bacterium]|jgi:PAS domain S-box-containing protein
MVLDHTEAETELSARVHQQEIVARIGLDALAGMELQALMDQSCALVCETLKANYCKVVEFLPDRNEFLMRAGSGWEKEIIGRTVIPGGLQSQSGYTVLRNEPVIVEDTQTETRFQTAKLLLDHGVISGISVLIHHPKIPFGALGVHTTTKRLFTRDDIYFLQSVANVLGVAIERKTDEEKLERNASWLRSLIATTQDAVISIDRSGRIVLFNAAAEKIFGYARDEVAGKKVNLLMAEPYRTEHDDYIERYERTGEAHAIGRIRTVTARRKNGESFPIELSVTKIAEDEDVQYAAFIRDISEKVALQQKVLQNERLVAIGATAAKIGHELANPLNGMALTVQLLEQRLKMQSSARGDQIDPVIRRLKNEINRLNGLLQDFRSFSKRERLDLRRTTLTALISEALEIELPRYTEKNIEVETSISSELPTLMVDIDRMKQVIINLTKNAVEAMPGGGKLSLHGSVSGARIVLVVADTGIGIPPGLEVFEPFFTTKPQGTGLGLAIIKQIIDAHGGSITYDSEPGKGARFTVALPHI